MWGRRPKVSLRGFVTQIARTIALIAIRGLVWLGLQLLLEGIGYFMAKGSPQFESTVWTQVLVAAREPDSSAGAEALSRLCQVYWFPIYAHIRRLGLPVADAEDLTQGFFVHILQNGFLSRADPGMGRFRNYLLGAVRHYLANDRERQGAQRRGGRAQKVSIDTDLAEVWLAAEPTVATDATVSFDRAWAVSVLKAAMAMVEAEHLGAGKGHLFHAVKEFLQRSASPGEYDEVARALQMSKGAVAAAVHRMTARFGELVKKVVRDSVADGDMAEEELTYLMRVLRR